MIRKGTMEPVGGRENFLAMGARYQDILILQPDTFAGLSSRYGLVEHEGPLFVRKEGTETIFVVREGQLEPVEGEKSFLEMGGSYASLKVLSESAFAALEKNPGGRGR